MITYLILLFFVQAIVSQQSPAIVIGSRPIIGASCPPNEGNVTCCEGSCATGPVRVCTLLCRLPIRCTCIQGYVRNTAGKCIKYSDCPRVCPTNQIFRTCPTNCEPTCTNRNLICISTPIARPPKCPPGRCQCKPGFVRNTITNQCISPSSCPRRPPIPLPTPRPCIRPICPLPQRNSKKIDKAPHIQNHSPAIVIGSSPLIGTSCPVNESNATCCEGTCSTGPIKVCTLLCRLPIRCTCIQGYVRNTAGKCMKYSDCPRVCPANQIFRTCPRRCEPTCTNRNPMCPIPRPCPPGRCQCSAGFVRNSSNHCILPSSCPRRPPFPIPTPRPCIRALCPAQQRKPEKARTLKEMQRKLTPARKATKVQNQSVRDILKGIGQFFCPANSRWVACRPCDGACTNRNPVCPFFCVQGQSGCQCNQGFVRNNNNQCISTSSCPIVDPIVCPSNEAFRSCASACEPTCQNQQPFCTQQCLSPRCQCNTGFVRQNGQCIRPQSCSGQAPTCSTNEIFRTCATSCEPTCANQNPTCTMQCQSPRCQCDTGFVRQNGQCIWPQSCHSQPQNCPANQVWNQCSTVCEPSCQNFTPTCNSFACGPPKCQCSPGFYRQSSAGNAPCVQWWQCFQWGGLRNGPRPPMPGNGGSGGNWWGFPGGNG